VKIDFGLTSEIYVDKTLISGDDEYVVISGDITEDLQKISYVIKKKASGKEFVGDLTQQ